MEHLTHGWESDLDAASLAEFVRTLVEASPMPGADGTVLADPAVLGGALRFFVGELDGRTVATAGARIGPGVNDVEWVSTRPEVRSRALRDARDRVARWSRWVASLARRAGT